ncbi:hypothetical protein GCM10009000_012220 [Halobacterium noricense]|uniref:UspA domain-containing protein n=2 Tax=Haladaptatus pallidirubidus TaxID=1008152 RepID=A0AAV3UCG5_9EURY
MATDRTVEFAASIADEWEGDVILANPVVRPSGTQFDGSDDLLDEHQKTAERALKTTLGPNTGVETRGTARVGRSLPSIVGEVSQDCSAGAVVIDDPGSATRSNPLGRNVPARLACSVDCDVLTVGGSHASKTISSVLVPVSGGPHSGLAVDVARYVAQAHGAWVELLHVIETGADERRRDDAEEYVSAARDRLGEFDDFDTWVLEADDATDAIIEQSKYYDMTVMGAPQKGRLREFVFGSTIGEVRSSAHNTVVTVERPHERDSLLGRWL